MPQSMQLSWIKCQSNVNPVWCELQTLNLAAEHFDGLEGVYVIWHGGQSPSTVRVGQGNIRDRLAAHRQDRQILGYAAYGLFVTWAAVEPPFRDGVERYVAESLRPLVGARFPDVPRVAVNLPG